jgi:uncharacterized protein
VTGLTGSLTGRIVTLVGVLRRAGVAVGTGETLLATRAAEAVGVARPRDLAEALAAALLRRNDDRPVFDAAFGAVFMAPPSDANPAVAVPAPRSSKSMQPRLAAALGREAASQQTGRASPLLEAIAASDTETLRHRDFEQMSAAEARAAQDLVRRAVRWWRRPVRRWRPSRRPGDVDARRTIREFARSPDAAGLVWRDRRQLPLRLVLVCDVSGSMRAYARAFLQLAHALAGRDRSVELFAFATRLTRLTPLLRTGDTDACLARIGTAVRDWDGGTRIGVALKRLNREFGSRVLGSSTVVLLLTDGLERGDPDELRAAARRLRRSCRAVIWLNPLLRYAEYEPVARGAAALAATVSLARPAHDPASLVTLVRVLAELEAGCR